jgi:hypothetical protein
MWVFMMACTDDIPLLAQEIFFKILLWFYSSIEKGKNGGLAKYSVTIW